MARKRAAKRKARPARRKGRRDPFARERALDALNQMRAKGYSLTRAAREASTTPATIRKYVGGAIRKSKSGRYSATASDRLTRVIWMLTTNGMQEVRTRNSRTASRIASFMSAVHVYAKKGDDSGLEPYQGRFERADGQFFYYQTDLDQIDRIASAGEISIERLYVEKG